MWPPATCCSTIQLMLSNEHTGRAGCPASTNRRIHVDYGSIRHVPTDATIGKERIYPTTSRDGHAYYRLNTYRKVRSMVQLDPVYYVVEYPLLKATASGRSRQRRYRCRVVGLFLNQIPLFSTTLDSHAIVLPFYHFHLPLPILLPFSARTIIAMSFNTAQPLPHHHHHQETYGYKVALNELKMELSTLRKSESTSLQATTASIQRDLDLISLKFREDFNNIKSEMQCMLKIQECND